MKTLMLTAMLALTAVSGVVVPTQSAFATGAGDVSPDRNGR